MIPSWQHIWASIEEAVRSSHSTSEAVSKVSGIRGTRTTWNALSRAWRRYGKGKCYDALRSIQHTGFAPATPRLGLPKRYTGGMGYRRHLWVPDTQCEPGAPDNHFQALGRFVVDKGFDVVVWGGDLRDFSSLSVYDSLKRKAAEGRCKLDDVYCGNAALERYQNELTKAGVAPETHIVYGNHDCRGPLGRPGKYMADNSEDKRMFLNIEHIEDSFGWHQHEFLQPVEVDGILYCHLFPFNTRGKQTAQALKMGAGDARTQVRAVMQSCTAGHSPGIDSCFHMGPLGQRYRGLIAGSFYQHKHLYNGKASYWQGVVVKNRVKDGDYDLTEVSLEYLLEHYGD